MKVRFFSFVLVVVQLILSGCSGYHFNVNNNPLIGYDIKTIAVPMFVNRSVLPQLTAPLTREITLALSDYSGLKVMSGDADHVDAILIGVIESKDHYNDVVKNTQLLFTEGEIANSIGKRSPFYYPVQTSYNLNLRLILIKRPTKEEIVFFTGDRPPGAKIIHPKVVLEDNINLTNNFSRVASATTGPGAAGEVNFVKNKAIFEKSLQDTSYQAGQTFKQVILNAF